MSDLISRSALIESFTKYKFGAISNDMEREYIKENVLLFINAQPTAYDVDKVVEQLEKEAEKAKRNSEKAEELGPAYERHMTVYGIKANTFDRAIEIVKAGCRE